MLVVCLQRRFQFVREVQFEILASFDAAVLLENASLKRRIERLTGKLEKWLFAIEFDYAELLSLFARLLIGDLNAVKSSC